MAKTSPATTGSFKCPNSDALQVVNESPKGAMVKRLIVATGIYDDLYALKFNSNPKFVSMNAAGLSHVDSFGYAVVKVASLLDSVLVRFDSNGLNFLRKLPGAGWASGGFGLNGDFYIYSNSGTGSLLKISDPSKIAWMTNEAADLPMAVFEEFKNIDAKTGDIIVIDADVGNGEKTYVLGVQSKKSDIFFVDVADNSKFTLASDLPTGAAWGSAWNFAGGAFFASNEGHGVFQLEMKKANLANFTITARKVGSSAEIGSNDGLNCANGFSPWPGCERFCIDNGCACMKPAAERCELKSCAQCPFCI
jgi:hypothetical protein